jgi:conjugal transfer ATP-binding protein TraC
MLQEISDFFAGLWGIVIRFWRWLFNPERPADEIEAPTPITDPTARVNFARFSQLLPYMAWMDEQRLFVLEGEEDQRIDGIGFALELCPQTGASPEMADLLGTLFTYLPAHASVQWSLMASPVIEGHLQSYMQARRRARADASEEEKERANMYRVFAARRARFFADGAHRSVVPNAPYLLKEFRLMMSVVWPASGLDDARLLNEITSLRETVVTTLKTYHLFKAEWGPEELINWCAIVLNPQQTMRGGHVAHINYDDGRPIKQQIVSPDTLIRPTENGMVFRSAGTAEPMVATCMSVRSYPKACTLHAMGGLIGDYIHGAIGYSSPFVITLGVLAQDFEETRNMTQMKAARATQKAESPMARFMPELRDQKHDWDLAQRAFDDGKGGTVKLYHQIVLFSTPNNTARAIQSAQAVWRARQFEIVPDTYMQIQAMLGTLPLSLTRTLQRDIKVAQRVTTKTATNAVNMAPLIAEWSGTGTPVVPLWGRRGQAMSIDLFANSGNYNACVVGTSGSGKSVFMNDMAYSYLSTGARVWCIDIGHSYEKLCALLGGQYIEFTDDVDIQVNPFALVTNIDEDIEMLVPMFAQMISPSAPLSDYLRRQLQMHVVSVWYDFGTSATVDHLMHSLLNNCEKGGPNPQMADEQYRTRIQSMTYEERQQYCDPRVRDMGVQIWPYSSDGPYGKYFNRGCNINFAADFVVLELEQLNQKKDLQTVILFLLMYKITQEMYQGGRERKKLCIIDEAWQLLSGGSASGAEFIEVGYRRARKYGAAFLTATQSVADYYKSAPAEAALTNADWMFMLRQKPESILAFEKADRLVIDENMRDMLMSLRKQDGAYSEVFVQAGQMGYGIGRVLLDPFTLLLVSSTAEDVEAINRHRRAGLTIVQAVEAVQRERGFALEQHEHERIAA